jgi:hypothetical protein
MREHLLNPEQMLMNKEREILMSTTAPPTLPNKNDYYLSKILTVLESIRDDAKEHHAAVMEHLTKPIELKSKTRNANADAILAQIKPGQNYNTAEIRKLLGIAPTTQNALLKKNFPGNWQSVGVIEFMTSADFVEAINNNSSFFRKGGD